MNSMCIRVANPPSLPPSSPSLPSSPSFAPPTVSYLSDQPDMKELSISTSKHSRGQVYPKKRPSPTRDGVSKSRYKDSPSSYPPRTPAVIRAELHRQRYREAQLQAFRREGIYVEEEYRDDIEFYMHEMERYTMGCANSMDQQPEIRWHMRPCLVDFLVEIHFMLRLRPETLYLTLNIVDRYVSRRIVFMKHYQLVGCAALWIAAKFEDAKDRVPTVTDLVHICQNTYDETAFLQMEGHVLATIQWTLGHPTAEAWLRFYCCSTYEESTKVQHVARFLMEITLFHREFIKFRPSVIARASLILARYVCQQTRRMFDESADCLEIIELLDQRVSGSVAELSESLVKKYSYPFYSKASTVVVQWYLMGNRFVRHVIPSLAPVTPISSRNTLSGLSTPMSSMTVSTDASSDDMPVTPTSPVFVSDPFVTSHAPAQSDKENVPTSLEPMVIPAAKYSAMDDRSAHDFQPSSFGRSALHDLNMLAPSPIRHVVA